MKHKFTLYEVWFLTQLVALFDPDDIITFKAGSNDGQQQLNEARALIYRCKAMTSDPDVTVEVSRR